MKMIKKVRSVVRTPYRYRTVRVYIIYNIFKGVVINESSHFPDLSTIGTAKRKHRKQQRAQKAIRRRGFEFLKKFPPRSTSVPTIPSTSAHCEAVPSIRSITKKSKFQNADPGRFARARG